MIDWKDYLEVSLSLRLCQPSTTVTSPNELEVQACIVYCSKIVVLKIDYSHILFGFGSDKKVKQLVPSEGPSNRNRYLGGAERAQTNPNHQ